MDIILSPPPLAKYQANQRLRTRQEIFRTVHRIVVSRTFDSDLTHYVEIFTYQMGRGLGARQPSFSQIGLTEGGLDMWT